MVDASAAGTWVRFEQDWWLGRDLTSKGIFGDLTQVKEWSRESLLLAMRLACDAAIWRGRRFPSRRWLADLAGWTEGRVRTLLRHEEWWVDPLYRARWEEVRPAKRAPPVRGAATPVLDEDAQAPKTDDPKPEPKRSSSSKPSWLAEHTKRKPALARWSHAELAAVVERLVPAILNRAAEEIEMRAEAGAILRLLAKCAQSELFDLESWADDVELVARAARQSRLRTFRWVQENHLQCQPKVICYFERWPERLQEARKWARASVLAPHTSDGDQLHEQDGDDKHDATTLEAWNDMIARLRRTTGDWRPRAELAEVVLADHPAEHARRADALATVLDLHLRHVPSDRAWLVDRDSESLEVLCGHWASFYGPSPPGLMSALLPSR